MANIPLGPRAGDILSPTAKAKLTLVRQDADEATVLGRARTDHITERRENRQYLQGQAAHIVHHARDQGYEPDEEALAAIHLQISNEDNAILAAQHKASSDPLTGAIATAERVTKGVNIAAAQKVAVANRESTSHEVPILNHGHPTGRVQVMPKPRPVLSLLTDVDVEVRPGRGEDIVTYVQRLHGERLAEDAALGQVEKALIPLEEACAIQIARLRKVAERSITTSRLVNGVLKSGFHLTRLEVESSSGRIITVPDFEGVITQFALPKMEEEILGDGARLYAESGLPVLTAAEKAKRIAKHKKRSRELAYLEAFATWKAREAGHAMGFAKDLPWFAILGVDPDAKAVMPAAEDAY